MNFSNMIPMLQQFAQMTNPEVWNDCVKMFQGKSRTEQVKQLKKLYKSKGMDLDAVAQQYGIQL